VTATALTVSKVMPYAVAAVLVGWMIAYGQRASRAGEPLAAAAQAGAEPEGRRAAGDRQGQKATLRDTD